MFQEFIITAKRKNHWNICVKNFVKFDPLGTMIEATPHITPKLSISLALLILDNGK